MAEEPENLTIRLLQELRARFDSVDEQLKDLRRDVHGNSVLMASLAGYLHDHEERIAVIEKSSRHPV